MKRDAYKVFGECLVFTLAFAILLGFVVACSDSDDKDLVGGASGDAGVIAITNKQIAGVAQKGPLVEGSSVVLRETSAEGNLKPTGKEYYTTITGDKGEFAIDSINLECQYVLLSAEGYYTHEYGDNRLSECQMRLDAVTDLANRNTSNINLLTHFEYKRVLKLFKSGKSFAEAKKQAMEEVFAMFGVNIEVPLAEDLNIFNTTEGDRTLYNLSIFVDKRELWDPWEGELDSDEEWEHWTNPDRVNCPNLQKFIDGIADDFADDGVLSDSIMQHLAYQAYDQVRSHNNAEFFDEEMMRAEKEMDSNTYDRVAKIKKQYDFGKFLFLNYMGVEQCTEDLWGEVRKFERPIVQYDRNLEQMATVDSGYLLCDGYSWEIKTKEQIDSLTMRIDHESGTMTDARDGKKYKTVSFVFNGKNYEWMAEDLKYEASSGLYSWTTAMQIDDKYMNQHVNEGLIDTLHQGICPDGWHVANARDWSDLVVYVGGLENLFDETWKTDRESAFAKSSVGVFHNRFDFNLEPMDKEYLRLYYHTYVHESFSGKNTEELWMALYQYCNENNEMWACDLAARYRSFNTDVNQILIYIGSAAWPLDEPTLEEARVRCVKD